MRRWAVGAAGLAVSAVALVVAFYRVRLAGGLSLEPRVHWHELRAALAGAEWGWLAGYLVLNAGSMVARAVQLRSLARRRDGGAPSLAVAYHAVAVSLLMQNLLPARLGEAARVVALAKGGDVAPAEATGAVVFGRVQDLFALILVTCLPSLLLPFGAASAGLRTVALVGTALGVALVVLLFSLVRRREASVRFAARLRPSLGRALGGFIDGLSALASGRRLVASLCAAVAAVIIIAGCYACALRAFHLDALPPGTSLVLVATIFLAVAVPSAPSSVGVYHAAVTWLLPALGAPLPAAAALALATHALGVLSFLLLGFVSMYKLGIRIADARAPAVT